MKSKSKAVISLLIAVTLLFTLLAPANAAEASSPGPLKFNSDGTFTIVQISDSQDTQWASPNMLTLIQKALNESKPDLVVFTGDQMKNYDSDFDGGNINCKVAKALDNIVKPLVRRGIPFAFAFGNHDGAIAVSLEDQVKMLQKYKGCLVVDEGPSVSGCGNYNLPILGSDGIGTAFNIYLLDSNQSEVLPDQVNWYISKSNELKTANGGKPVPSIEFQHIVPYNENVYGSFAAQGDIIASFFGHNHYRSDTFSRLGVDYVYTPTAGFNEFGPEMERGVRVIELNENDTSAYKTHVLTFIGLLGDNPVTDLRYKLFTLGGLDGDANAVALEVISGIGKAIFYAAQQSSWNPVKMAGAVLDFFGVDIILIRD